MADNARYSLPSISGNAVTLQEEYTSFTHEVNCVSPNGDVRNHPLSVTVGVAEDGKLSVIFQVDNHIVGQFKASKWIKKPDEDSEEEN